MFRFMYDKELSLKERAILMIIVMHNNGASMLADMEKREYFGVSFTEIINLCQESESVVYRMLQVLAKKEFISVIKIKSEKFYQPKERAFNYEK